MVSMLMFVICGNVRLIVVKMSVVTIFVSNCPSRLNMFFLGRFRLFLGFIRIPTKDSNGRNFMNVTIFTRTTRRLLRQNKDRSTRNISRNLFKGSVYIASENGNAVRDCGRRFLLKRKDRYSKDYPCTRKPYRCIRLPMLLRSKNVRVRHTMIVTGRMIRTLKTVLFGKYFINYPSYRRR